MHTYLFAETGPVENLRQIGEATGFDIQHFLSQVFVVLVVAGVLQKFAFGPVMNILEKRRQAIEQGIADADRSKQALADAESTRREIIQKANATADGIVAEAEKAAQVRAERRAQEATVQAEDILRNAREAAKLERDRLFAELKREVGSLVVQTTEKIAGKVLTADDQTRLNAEAQAQVNASNN